jgi:integrase
MAKQGFSDLFLRSLPLPEKGQRAYWDDKLPSFGIRVSQGGSKTFILNRNNTFVTIGRYGILSLSEARAEAKRLLAEFTLGKVRPHAIVYPQAVKLFIEDKARSRRKNTYQDYQWFLGRLSFTGQLSDITHDDITRALKRIKSPSTYDHVLVAARILFNWAMRRRYITHNPTFGLSPHGTPTRTRVLSDIELKSIWEASAYLGPFGLIVRLLILTGQRRGEIAALKVDWLTQNTCTIPKEIAKNNREHTFPIGLFTVALIADEIKQHPTKSGLIFPARGKQTPFNGWSKSKVQLDALSGVNDWTLHDLRRTFATNMAALGVPVHVLEKLLNHVSGTISGVAAVYNRHQFMDEMRDAVDKWEARLTSLLKT